MSTSIQNIQIRQGTAAAFATFTPLIGEPCYVTDTDEFFVGDGVTVGATLLAVHRKSLMGRRSAKTGAYTVIASDRGKCLDATTGTWSLSLTAAATLGDGFSFALFNSGTGVITIDPNGSETILDALGSATTKTLTQGEGALFFCDGTGWKMLKVSAGGQTLATLGAFLNTRTAKTGAYTMLAADKGQLIDATTGTWSLSLTAAATLGAGWTGAVFNSGTGVITIDPNGSETIRDAFSSATTKTLAQGEAMFLVCDGTGFLGFKFTSSSAAASGITYNNATSGLTATNVQAALDELKTLIGGGGGGGSFDPRDAWLFC